MARRIVETGAGKFRVESQFLGSWLSDTPDFDTIEEAQKWITDREVKRVVYDEAHEKGEKGETG